MRWEKQEFTGTLKGKIAEAERKLGKMCEALNLQYQEAAAAKSADIRFELSRRGYDTFSAYYCSEVTLRAASKEVYRIVIWECRRQLLGMPAKWNLPGSRIVGDFMDSSCENVGQILQEQAETLLDMKRVMA